MLRLASTARTGLALLLVATSEVTGKAQYEAWEEGAFPQVEMVAPGLWSIPVPIPNNPLRYVLVYALELASGDIALIDAGWNTQEAWEALTGGLESIGADISNVRHVLVTHIHPDHYGLAGRVREASGATLALHPADAALITGRYEEPEGLLKEMHDFLELMGVPQDQLANLATSSMMIRALVQAVSPDVLLEDEDLLDLPDWDLQCIWTPGHSPGHVCFWSRSRAMLFSGDHLLPRITPNISFHSQQHPNPLGDFLDSLAKVAKLSEEGTEDVLPAHQWRFRGLLARAQEIGEHHEARMREVLAILRDQGQATPWEITVKLHWSRPWEEIAPYMQRAACGETMAHLIVLELRGLVKRRSGTPVIFVPQEAS
jgi:glyoxylase-like metal-dependent hydrolase (beta-lactamase superfamily II)